MRIITHNMLKCNVRGVESGYPLIIEPEKVEIIPCDFNQGETFPSTSYADTA
jgi:multifunctional methyltransferase subunit TRM112